MIPARSSVSQALQAVDKEHNYLITGFNNWLLSQLQRFVTRRRLLLVAEEMLRPKAKIKIKAINI